MWNTYCAHREVMSYILRPNSDQYHDRLLRYLCNEIGTLTFPLLAMFAMWSRWYPTHSEKVSSTINYYFSAWYFWFHYRKVECLFFTVHRKFLKLKTWTSVCDSFKARLYHAKLSWHELVRSPDSSRPDLKPIDSLKIKYRNYLGK